MKKIIYYILGFVSLAFAYIGFVTPGIPFSIFLVFSAYCFARSSTRMHNWIYSHRLFGEFLINWEKKKVFPQKMKYFMLVVMLSTLIITWLITNNIVALLWSTVAMTLVAVWAWRYPCSVEEYEKRIHQGRKIGWIT